MTAREARLGVSKIHVSDDELAYIASVAEEAAQEKIRRIGGRRVKDALVTVEARREEDGTITIVVDVGVLGAGLGPLSYDELVEEAVEEAFQAAEKALLSLVSSKSTGDATPRQRMRK